MPTFQITAPDGKKYKISGETAEGAYAALQQHIGTGNPAPVDQATSQLDDYYSSGIYAGEYNPLGPIAQSVDAGATGIRDAVTFGFGDEIFGGGDRQEALRESNPVASVMGNIAGGLALPGGGLTQNASGALQGARGIGAAVMPNLAPGASLLSRVGVGAGEGFGMGALYGAGSGEDGSRAESALINGGIGAVGGAVIPLVAQGISSGYRNIADSLSRSEVARQSGVSPEVARQLAQTLDADGTLGSVGRSNMAAAGGEAMLADAGPNARQVLDTAIQRGGPGAVLARGRIDERVGRDAAALTGALDSTLGTPQGLTSANTGIRQGTSAARGSAYDAAYAAPINYADPRGVQIEEIVKGRVPSSAISKANELMRVEGLKSNQIKATISDDGTAIFETLPDVRQLDYITRGLNDVASEADGKGAMGGTTAVGRAYSDLSKELRGTLRQLVPEYGIALDTASDAISQSKMVKLGGNILSPASTMDDVAIATNGISASERDALKQGIRSNIENRVANVTRTVQDGNTDAREAMKAIKDLSSRANREKVSAAIGDTEAKRLFDEVDRVGKSFELRGSVAENSKTFARQSTNEMVTNSASPGAAGTLGRGEGINATKKVIQALTGQTDEAIRGREDAIFSEIADYLTRPAAQAIPAFQAMQNFQGQSVANQVRASEIARLLSQGRNLVYPASGQASNRLQR